MGAAYVRRVGTRSRMGAGYVRGVARRIAIGSVVHVVAAADVRTESEQRPHFVEQRAR